MQNIEREGRFHLSRIYSSPLRGYSVVLFAFVLGFKVESLHRLSVQFTGI